MKRFDDIDIGGGGVWGKGERHAWILRGKTSKATAKVVGRPSDADGDLMMTQKCISGPFQETSTPRRERDMNISFKESEGIQSGGLAPHLHGRHTQSPVALFSDCLSAGCR